MLQEVKKRLERRRASVPARAMGGVGRRRSGGSCLRFWRRGRGSCAPEYLPSNEVGGRVLRKSVIPEFDVKVGSRRDFTGIATFGDNLACLDALAHAFE